MKRVFATTTLFGLILVAAFGFTTMGHADEHGMARNGCIASEAQGMSCPATGNPFDAAIFHLDVLKSITMGVLPLSAIGVLLAGLLGMFLLSRAGLDALPFGLASSPFDPVSAVQNRMPRAQEHLITWLTLCEKRDPALAS